MHKYLTQYYIAENSLTGCNGTIFDSVADFFGEFNVWELKHGEDYTVHDFKEKDCTSEKLKEKNRSSVHVTAI